MGIIFGVFGIGFVLSGIMLGGSLGTFVDLPSIAIVSGITVFFTLAFHGVTPTLGALNAGFSSDRLPAEHARRDVRILLTARMLASASGVIGTLIGCVNMLANLDDPTKIGPAMAVALLTLLYAVCLAEGLFGPLINRLRNHSEDNGEEEPTKMAPVTMIAIPLVMIIFLILAVTFN